MKISLIDIEKRLKDLFENRMAAVPDRSNLAQLSSLLMEKIESNLQINNGLRFSPSSFTIKLDASINDTSSHEEIWEETIRQLVRQIISENDLRVASELQIKIISVDNPQKPFEVITAAPQFKSGNTIPIDKESTPARSINGSVKSLGYLIFPTGEEYAVEKPETTIGRTEEADITIDNLLISRYHARITIENNQPFISDLDSVRGTFVNGNKIQRQALFPGDVITIGDISMVFVQGDDINESVSTNTTMI